jgi:hypothetical protein
MHPWIAQRTAAFDSSGIRKVFDLAANMTDPINLSIGQPDFDVPQPIKRAAIEAIEGVYWRTALRAGAVMVVSSFGLVALSYCLAWRLSPRLRARPRRRARAFSTARPR